MKNLNLRLKVALFVALVLVGVLLKERHNTTGHPEADYLSHVIEQAVTVSTWGDARVYCKDHPKGSVQLDVVFTCTVVNRYRSEPSESDLARDGYDQPTDSFDGHLK